MQLFRVGDYSKTIRNQQGGFDLSPEENDQTTALQASCKRSGETLYKLTMEAAIGLLWAVLTLVSIIALLASNSGVTDFRYVGF